MPSACTNRQTERSSRARDEIAGRIRHRLRLASAALLLAAAPFAAEAGDFIQGYFQLPAAQVSVSDGDAKSTWVNDLNLMNPLCGPNQVRSATLENGIGFASAQAGKGYGHFAMAGSTYGFATGSAGVWVYVRDPENRGTVKLNMAIKGFASAPDPIVVSSGAQYQVYVARALSDTPRATLLDDGCTVYSAQAISDALLTPLIYALTGYDHKLLDLQGNVQTSNGVKVYRYGLLTDTTEQSYEPRDITIEIEPNTSIVVVVSATVLYGGMAVVDPIITAHPDNADVEIEITGVPDEDTGRHPLDGFTAEDLAALGIDPQPFVNLGFLWTTTATSTLDVDASLTNTKYDALTDGLLTLRYLFGLTGTSLTAGALGSTATRTDPAAIKAYLDVLRPALDVDGNGTAEALTDGLLILRHMFGLRGDALIVGVVDPQATRKTAADIEAYLLTLMP